MAEMGDHYSLLGMELWHSFAARAIWFGTVDTLQAIRYSAGIKYR